MPRTKEQATATGESTRIKKSLFFMSKFERGSLKKRAQSVLEYAEQTGLLEGGKGQVIRGRMPEKLVAVAKARTGITSDTKLIEVALANLAVADDYGSWLLSRAGRIPKDTDLEF